MKILSVVVVAIAAFVALASAVDVVRIDGESMAPELRNNQIVLVNRLAYGFQLPLLDAYIIRWGRPGRGDIVFFHHPLDGRVAVKRCIGVAGDAITVARTTGRIAGNRVELSPFAAGRLRDRTRLDRGEIFVLGDNRVGSQDSRHYGPIRESDVFGVLFGFQLAG
ncbi:MAG: signal peptidase I [Spirochaetota bacterium]